VRKGGQKAKSNAHQRRVAGIFTLAYYPAGEGLFKSTPGSGGWDKRAAPGDIIAFKYVSKEKDQMVIDETFPMTIECKDWKDENVKHFFSGLYSDESQLFGWMEQSLGDSFWVKKVPIVVFKLYRTENVAMVMSTDFQQLAKMFGNFVGKIYRLGRTREKGFKADGIGTLVFVLLKDFIQWIDWEIYKKGVC